MKVIVDDRRFGRICAFSPGTSSSVDKCLSTFREIIPVDPWCRGSAWCFTVVQRYIYIYAYSLPRLKWIRAKQNRIACFKVFQFYPDNFTFNYRYTKPTL